MKTLSDFKRRLKIGQLMHCHNHLFNIDMGIRPIKRIQSNAFTFETPKGESWCYFPKASEVRFIDDNTMQILEQERTGQYIPALTYRFICDDSPVDTTGINSMKAITLNDFLTPSQIKEVVKLKTMAAIRHNVILPNMKEINQKLGQENDATFLAYACEYVVTQIK